MPHMQPFINGASSAFEAAGRFIVKPLTQGGDDALRYVTSHTGQNGQQFVHQLGNATDAFSGGSLARLVNPSDNAVASALANHSNQIGNDAYQAVLKCIQENPQVLEQWKGAVQAQAIKQGKFIQSDEQLTEIAKNAMAQHFANPSAATQTVNQGAQRLVQGQNGQQYVVDASGTFTPVNAAGSNNTWTTSASQSSHGFSAPTTTAAAGGFLNSLDNFFGGGLSHGFNSLDNLLGGKLGNINPFEVRINQAVRNAQLQQLQSRVDDSVAVTGAFDNLLAERPELILDPKFQQMYRSQAQYAHMEDMLPHYREMNELQNTFANSQVELGQNWQQAQMQMRLANQEMQMAPIRTYVESMTDLARNLGGRMRTATTTGATEAGAAAATRAHAGTEL